MQKKKEEIFPKKVYKNLQAKCQQAQEEKN